MRKNILIIVSFLAATLLFNSCLKDKVGIDWTDSLKGKMYAEVWNGGKATFPLLPVPDSVTFKFMVNIATDKVPTQDITLTLAVNDSARAGYNRLNKTSYKLYPNIFIRTPSILIKAGTRNAYAYVTIWNAQTLNACDQFMAPISIVDATGGVIPADPIGQGSRLMVLPISNPYQGTYHSTGTFVHPTAGVRVIDEIKELKTEDCKSVSTTIGDLGDQGDYKVVFTINDDNTVTISGAESSTQPLKVGSGWINAYDPATKTFTVNYYYEGAGGNREIHEVLVRQ